MNQSLNQDIQSTRKDVILFAVSDKLFGLPVDAIKEIIKPLNLSKLPLAPDSVEGLVNVREDIYPLISLEKLFRLDHLEATEEDERLILVKYENTSCALRVNQVESLSSYLPSEIQEREDDTSEIKRYTEGSFSHTDNKLVYLLSLQTITESLIEEARKLTS